MWVQRVGHSYQVSTTFHSSNYNLPSDLFKAILLCGDDSIDDPSRVVVERYAPSLVCSTNPDLVRELLEEDPPPSNEDPDMERVNHFLSRVNLRGIQREPNDSPTDPRSQKTWIYGHGTKPLSIHSVGRYVTDSDVTQFVKKLLLSGSLLDS